MSGSFGVTVLSETVGAAVAGSEACDACPSLEGAAVSSGEAVLAILVELSEVDVSANMLEEEVEMTKLQ
jgi:hypothetical protein